MTAWLEVAASTGVGIVQWDEPQLALPFRTGATRYACCCDVCAAAFRERFGTPLPEVATPEVEVFNDDLLAELIAWLVAAARARGLESAVVLLPDENYEPARAREAAQLPGVRYFGTTPFVLRNGVASGEIDSYLGSWAELMLQATEGSAARAVCLGAGVRCAGRTRRRDLPGDPGAGRARRAECLRLVISRMRGDVGAGLRGPRGSVAGDCPGFPCREGGRGHAMSEPESGEPRRQAMTARLAGARHQQAVRGRGRAR